MNKTSKARSYAMLIGSMLIFGTIGIFRRWIPISSALLCFFRGMLGGTTLLVFLLLRKKGSFRGIGVKKFLLLALTGALIGANWMLLFEAYNKTTVATATLCYYMQPTFLILLSPLVFREKLTLRKLLCALTAVIGMVFVSGFADGGGVTLSELSGVFLGLGGAILYAVVIILNKKVTLEDAYRKTVIQLFSASLVMVPYLCFTESASSLALPTLPAILAVIVVGVIHTGFAYALYFGSMSSLPAQSIAVLSYIDPVSALLLSALILREPLTPFGILGAVCIIGSALVCELVPDKPKIN